MPTTVGGRYDGAYKYIYRSGFGAAGEVCALKSGEQGVSALGLSCDKPLRAEGVLRRQGAQKKPESSGVQLCP